MYANFQSISKTKEYLLLMIFISLHLLLARINFNPNMDK